MNIIPTLDLADYIYLFVTDSHGKWLIDLHVCSASTECSKLFTTHNHMLMARQEQFGVQYLAQGHVIMQPGDLNQWPVHNWLQYCVEWSSGKRYQVYSLVVVYSSGVSLISCTSVFLSLHFLWHDLSVLSDKQPVSQHLWLCCYEYSIQHSWQTPTASQFADDSSFLDTVADWSQSFLLPSQKDPSGQFCLVR